MSNLIIYAIQMYQLLLVLYAVISWFPQASNTPLSKWLERLCEPYVTLFDSQLTYLYFTIILTFKR